VAGSSASVGHATGTPRSCAALSTSSRSVTLSAMVTARAPPAAATVNSMTVTTGRSAGQSGKPACCSNWSIARGSKPTFSMRSAVVEYCWT
jgi:hypothetical protein